MYTLEVYLNTDKNIDEIHREVAASTGEVATFIDEGRHMIAAHRITLELLEEISKHDDVDKIKGTRIPRNGFSRTIRILKYSTGLRNQNKYLYLF